MNFPSDTLREMRRRTGLSQRALAGRAGTSQPAVARYESGASTPSWKTLERLAAACGQRPRLRLEGVPDAHDVELTRMLLGLTPLERLRTLARYGRLRSLAEEQT
jgi:transcriptional regulator with XRE-family HTH domain